MAKLCLGTVQLGMDYGVQGGSKPSREKAEAVLDFAIQNGVDALDTAAAYGDAEQVLGNYFQARPELISEVQVIAKLPAGALVVGDEDNWERTVLANAAGSIQRMGLARLKAYLFHDASCIFDDRAVQALYAVVRDGLAQKAGVSVYTPEEAMKALAYDEIGVIQIPYNLFDRRLDRCGFFKKAYEKGTEVYARSSLLQGLLAMDPDLLPERVRFAEGYLREYRAICSRFDLTPLRAAVGFAVHHPGINYVVFGVDTQEQLKEYVSAREERLPEEAVCQFERAFANVEEKLVNPSLWK